MQSSVQHPFPDKHFQLAGMLSPAGKGWTSLLQHLSPGAMERLQPGEAERKRRPSIKQDLKALRSALDEFAAPLSLLV